MISGAFRLNIMNIMGITITGNYYYYINGNYYYYNYYNGNYFVIDVECENIINKLVS